MYTFVGRFVVQIWGRFSSGRAGGDDRVQVPLQLGHTVTPTFVKTAPLCRISSDAQMFVWHVAMSHRTGCRVCVLCLPDFPSHQMSYCHDSMVCDSFINNRATRAGTYRSLRLRSPTKALGSMVRSSRFPFRLLRQTKPRHCKSGLMQE